MPKIVDIVGHLLQQEQLQNDIECKNVSHAYLFSGPAHIGKRSLALRFAYDLLSQNVPESQRDAVKASIENLTHPDLLVLDALWMADTQDDWDEIAKYSNVPQAHRKKKNVKTNVIGIDEVRVLQERLHETGTGTYRCCIITSVERMHSEAANAFLKLLEEPPEGLVFLLTAQAQSSLLPTITSRARNVLMRHVPMTDMQSLLDGVDEDDKAFISHIARGAPGMVIALRDDPDTLRIHKTVHMEAQSFWNTTSASKRMNMLKPMHKRSPEADQLLLHLGLSLREAGSSMQPNAVQAYQQFARGLQTNAHRQLLAQRFALDASVK